MQVEDSGDIAGGHARKLRDDSQNEPLWAGDPELPDVTCRQKAFGLTSAVRCGSACLWAELIIQLKTTLFPPSVG